MLELFKPASAVLALTVALTLPIQGLEAASDQAKPAGTLAKQTQTIAETPQRASETTSSERREAAPSAGIKTFDALAVRPVTFVTSVFSAGAFVLSLPFTALDPALDVEQARENLVDEPFRDTFRRPLGDFNGSAWGEP